MLPVVVLDAARRDQLDQAEYFDSVGGEALGDRFLDGCQSAFERLAAFPESGTTVAIAMRLSRVAVSFWCPALKRS